jgi:hypothetical protein
MHAEQQVRLRISLQHETESRIRGLVSVNLSATDLEWFADWLLMVGLQAVEAALRRYPELTVGDLIRTSFRPYD